MFNAECALTANFSLPAPPYFLDPIGSVVRRHIQAAIYLSPDHRELEPFESETDIILPTLFAVTILVASITFPYLVVKLAQAYPSSMSPEMHVPISVPKVSDPAFILSLDCLCRCCDHRPRNENPDDDTPAAPFWKTFRKYTDSSAQTTETTELLEQARAAGLAQRKERAQLADEAARLKDAQAQLAGEEQRVREFRARLADEMQQSQAERARLAEQESRQAIRSRIGAEQRQRYRRLRDLLGQTRRQVGAAQLPAAQFEVVQLINAIEYNMEAYEAA